jgi:hypothetical protein
LSFPKGIRVSKENPCGGCELRIARTEAVEEEVAYRRLGVNPNVAESVMLLPGRMLIVSAPAIGVGPVVLNGSV